ncbi:hypothetical protein DMN91_002358 [Ooceraea biroi]|uniref:Uncharacterized protein n=1 Tax=Ooceraea biroi TaxID=2015173 RepID=A0A3L8E0Z1_OOCBI|nr:hypothetical protein DMN91_002358 [Ooceraea biroi]
MMSRSGAGIPTASRVARVEREAAPSAHWSKRKSDVPTRGRGHYGGTTQRESASCRISKSVSGDVVAVAAAGLLRLSVEAFRTWAGYVVDFPGSSLLGSVRHRLRDYEFFGYHHLRPLSPGWTEHEMC